MGLRQQILKAPDAETIDKLLEEGNSFEYASQRTINSWANAANKRLNQLRIQKSVSKIPKPELKSKPENRRNRHKKSNVKNR